MYLDITVQLSIIYLDFSNLILLSFGRVLDGCTIVLRHVFLTASDLSLCFCDLGVLSDVQSFLNYYFLDCSSCPT